jgi:PIN domain nuclease of toxin-antitoxin system
VWLTSEPAKLSERAQEAINAADELFVSDVSTWEICLKWQAKKLTLPSPPRRWITEQAGLWSLSRLPIEQEDLFRTSELPDHHKDPFDRLLVAQTLARNAQIITPDAAIHAYPVAVLW